MVEKEGNEEETVEGSYSYQREGIWRVIGETEFQNRLKNGVGDGTEESANGNKVNREKDRKTKESVRRTESEKR